MARTNMGCPRGTLCGAANGSEFSYNDQVSPGQTTMRYTSRSKSLQSMLWPKRCWDLPFFLFLGASDSGRPVTKLSVGIIKWKNVNVSLNCTKIRFFLVVRSLSPLFPRALYGKIRAWPLTLCEWEQWAAVAVRRGVCVKNQIKYT